MGIEAWIVIALIVGVLALLAFSRIAPDAIMAAALTALVVIPVPTDAGWKMGVVNLRDAFAGFSNTGMLTVGVLFVVVAGLRETGGVDWIAGSLLGRPKGLRRALVRVVFPVWGMSVFLNNTPVVAMMIPAISDWAKKLKVSPSKLMIPLSYSAIIGGTCSLIGTSTNLVVAGLVLANPGSIDGKLGMFTITWVGLPCAIVGMFFLIFMAPKLLPDRKSASNVMADPKEYTLELMVPAGSPLAGKTVEQAGLRNLPGCFLVEIDREGEVLSAIGPDQVLRAEDRLLFAGVVESIRDVANLRGLVPATNQVFKLDSPRYRRRLFEAVVSPSCALVGKTIRQGRFRNVYDGAVIAVARNGERVRGKLGDIELEPGDVLLVEAEPGFGERTRNSRDFLLVSALEDSTPRRHAKAPLAVFILIAMVALATIGVYDMLAAALLAAGAMVITRCCTVSEARQGIDWSVLIVIGAALGLGAAMESSGAAAGMAGAVLGIARDNPWLALIAIYFVTMLMTEVITNNAAVALTFPIALETAQGLDVNFMPFVIAIMMAGSASFATPLGYQTNLMVYGPGGYTLKDFLRIGVPMNLLMGVTTVVITPFVFPFHTSP
ncbi:MAG: SLC13 family permease [Phycisphaerales bacterium]|nr:SLC13 family permease [Phycisphaerales bacterium]